MIDEWRLGTSRNLAVDSSGGAVVSATPFGSQTYAVRLNFPGSESSTGGVRISFEGNAGSTSALLSPHNPEVFKVTPGQRVSAISNDAGILSLNIVELTR